MIKAILACMLASATAFVAPVSKVASSVSMRAVPEVASAISTLSVADLPTLVAPTEGEIGGFIDSGLFALFFAVSIIGGLPLLVYLRLASLEE